MFVHIRKIDPHDDDPEVKFIEATVIFDDDEKNPPMIAELAVYLQKDDKMTIFEIKAVAVQKAR